MRVLLVDDEPPILHSTRLLLESLGHEVVATFDHRDVLRLLREARPDVLVQDVRMPGLDLAALVASIRRDPDVARVPIVLFSADMDLEDVGETLRVPVLEKPFTPTQLETALAHAAAP